MRRRMALALMMVALAVPLSATGSPTYGPPYATGPGGGDDWNLAHTDPDSGRITLVRAHPLVGALGCEGEGAWATWEVTHTVTDPVSAVAAHYSEAVTDSFTWMLVWVRDVDGVWLGSAMLRGPVVGDGALEAQLFAGSPPVGTQLAIHVGLQLASACPNVDAGTARFHQVTVS